MNRSAPPRHTEGGLNESMAHESMATGLQICGDSLVFLLPVFL